MRFNLDQLSADELRELVRQQAEVITRNDRELNWRKIKIDKLTHEVRSFAAVCRMVAAGGGIGMVPRSSVSTVDRLKTVEITDAWAPRDLQLCIRERSALSPAGRALLDHLALKGPG